MAVVPPFSFLAGVTILLIILNTNADILHFPETSLQTGVPQLKRVVEMYAKKDSPSISKPGNGKPYIKAQFDFKTFDGLPVNGAIQIMIMQSWTLDSIGYEDHAAGADLEFCCTSQMMRQSVDGCSNVNELIVTDKDGLDVYSIFAKFDGEATTSVSERYYVKSTGPHIMIISNCDPNVGEVIVSGVGEWMNPFGYLPGRVYGFLPFYGVMCIIYGFIAFVWFILNLMHWRELVEIQNYITVVLSLCLLEMLTWYFDYDNLNNTGIRHVGAVVTGILLSSFRRALSRMLILAVSLGFSVVRPNLGDYKWKIFVLGIIYFLFEGSLELVIRYGQTNEVGKHWRAVLALPVAILNAIFYWWIFLALYRIMAQLKARNQVIKFQLYNRFTKVLISSLFASILFTGYQWYYMATDQVRNHWGTLWLLEGGFAQILYTLILSTIGILWRPSKNSRRYAYSQVVSVLDNEVNEIELEDLPSDPKKVRSKPKFIIGDEQYSTDDEIENERKDSKMEKKALSAELAPDADIKLE